MLNIIVTIIIIVFLFRVSPDKVLPKKNPSFGKKASNTGSPSVSVNISPQPMMHSDKAAMSDKLSHSQSERSKFKLPERSPQPGILSLPEVKGASEAGE